MGVTAKVAIVMDTGMHTCTLAWYDVLSCDRNMIADSVLF
jgi:hypothetical protein